jgi:hypothetical protein
MDSERKSANDLKEDYLAWLKCLKLVVNLMNDIYLSAWENYGSAKRMYPHRQLCMGTLIIARNNTEAAIHLVGASLIHQVHYISRNMLELAINLYYILDNKAERESRLERYRRYSDEVLPFKVLKVANKYPDEFRGQVKEGMTEVKEGRHKEFLQRYGNGSARSVNTQSWSGMTLDRMIGLLTDNAKKRDLTLDYEFIMKLNNWYLHPSWMYLKLAVEDTAVRDKDYQDYMAQMAMIFRAGEKIIVKFLDNFPKGRPVFQERLTEISGLFRFEKNPEGKAERP